jgi:hypothetical protein
MGDLLGSPHVASLSFRSFDALDYFKLNVGSCFRLLCSLSFMAIFLLSLFNYCLVAW